MLFLTKMAYLLSRSSQGLLLILILSEERKNKDLLQMGILSLLTRLLPEGSLGTPWLPALWLHECKDYYLNNHVHLQGHFMSTAQSLQTLI